MHEKIVEQVITNLDDKYIEEALNYRKENKNNSLRMIWRVGKIAACIVLIFGISYSTLSFATASGNMMAYEVLSTFSPDLASKLTPVNVSCEDQEIKMEVESIYVNGNSADIYISMQDLTGDRIDETTDLFDSYSIHTNADQVGGCSFVQYDEESKTATFLISIQQENGKMINHKKLSFSVSKLLCNKKNTELELNEIKVPVIPIVKDVQTDVKVRGYSRTDEATLSTEDTSNYLCPDKANIKSPADGVKITAYGFIGDKLHVQAYYDDITSYDNHGFVYLKDADGNRKECVYSTSFWDKDCKGSYEEYIFDIKPDDKLDQYTLWGDFTTCDTLIEGNWKVTFPIENYGDSNTQK